MGTMRDYDIRIALRTKLRSDHAAEPDTLIIEELGLHQGDVRADMAVINGSIHGFEIKSERDTLERLPRQRLAYDRCFDAITLVVGARHLESAKATVPAEWGILLAREISGSVELETVRPAGANHGVRPESVVQLLWREEALAILADLGMSSGMRSKSRRALWECLVSAVGPDELRRLVREKLKARGDWRPAMRRARGNGSSPTGATTQDSRANLDWLISRGFQNPPD